MTDVSRANPTRGLAAGLGISSSMGIGDGPENAALGQFWAAIAEAGLTPPEFITTDGKLQRFSSDGRRCDKAGWYVFHTGDIPAGPSDAGAAVSPKHGGPTSAAS